MAEPSRRVLVVDDDPVLLKLVTALLENQGYQVVCVETGAEALKRLRRKFQGVLVLDVNLPDSNGLDLFYKARELAPDVPVVMLTGYGTTDLAIQTITDGAIEFIDKERLVDLLGPAVVKAFRARGGSMRDDGTPVFPEIVTESREMRALFRSIRDAVESKVTVLIRGESGTGKELVARAVHDNGPRAGQPFVAINCAGIPETLLEAEIFGHERGAFTGARQRKLGKFELAAGGTLFLDEIGEMHPSLQAKLLRVLQEGEFQRLGGVETIRADVRIISATHRDLEKEVEAGGFREDLYYRLAVFTLQLPPLRGRTGDIPLLANYFADKFAAREGKGIAGIDNRVLEILELYSFPGNVRELENVISYAVVRSQGLVLTIGDLSTRFLQHVADERKLGPIHERRAAAAQSAEPPSVREPAASDAGSSNGDASTADDGGFPSLQEMEKRHLVEALKVSGGNKAQAARALGISRMTLYRKMKDLKI